VGAGFLSFTGVVNVVRLDDASELAAVDGFVVILLVAARFGCVVGAISMPNIPERSSLASTFPPAGPLPCGATKSLGGAASSHPKGV
jgi:hypothetical protein